MSEIVMEGMMHGCDLHLEGATPLGWGTPAVWGAWMLTVSLASLRILLPMLPCNSQTILRTPSHS